MSGILGQEKVESGNCTKNVNECDVIENPCGHGTCNDTEGSYICICDSGWENEEKGISFFFTS